MKSRMLTSLTLCLALAACGGGSDTGLSGNAEPEKGPPSTPTAAPKSASFIKASLSGALAGELQSNTALSGAIYNRYHLNFAGTIEGVEGGVVIAFGRDDTSSPAAGTYQLGANADFGGSVEFHNDDDRSFDITSGELIITNARGDSLSGTFSLQATEFESKASIETKGSFQTRPAN